MRNSLAQKCRKVSSYDSTGSVSSADLAGLRHEIAPAAAIPEASIRTHHNRHLRAHRRLRERETKSSTWTSSSFGYVTGTVGRGAGVNGTGGGRAIQLGCKFTFQQFVIDSSPAFPRRREGRPFLFLHFRLTCRGSERPVPLGGSACRCLRMRRYRASYSIMPYTFVSVTYPHKL
jgi:hypothetical protein